MPDKPRLTEAVDAYLLHRKSEGKAPGTIKNEARVLRRLITVCGDVYLSTIADKHVSAFFTATARTRSANSMTIDYSALSCFFAWAVRNRYVARYANPMDGRKAPRPMPRERQRVHMKDFTRLLDAAAERHPRDRMVVALGLYLFLRGSEVRDLRIGDVNLDDGEISVRVFKTKQIDSMPIAPTLDRELRAWLTYYTTECGPLSRDWYLVPALRRPRMLYDPERRRYTGRDGLSPLNPQRPICRIEEIPKAALGRIGFEVTTSTGEPNREGMHTLRRSGARARFDTLEARGYDNAIRHVQTLLHHASMAQTEHYLGLSIDRVKRNELVKGGPMFAFEEEGQVVSIQAAREASG